MKVICINFSKIKQSKTSEAIVENQSIVFHVKHYVSPSNQLTTVDVCHTADVRTQVPVDDVLVLDDGVCLVMLVVNVIFLADHSDSYVHLWFAGVVRESVYVSDNHEHAIE